MIHRIAAVTALAALAMPITAAAQPVPSHIAGALAAPARPEADKARDAARKPGELLAWAGVKPGDKVADLIIGGGYFTRILSGAVGPQGRIYAYQPGEFIGFTASYAEAIKAAAMLPNVTALDMKLGELDLPDGLDLIITVQNYHDFHLNLFAPGTAARVNAELFKSLKKGGVLIVVDHEAAAGSGLSATNTLHRIDIAQVKKELAAAGFRLEAESQLLDVPADPRTANVFDPSIRGKTDQFALKFRKP